MCIATEPFSTFSRRFSKNDLIGTVIMPLKDADLYGMLMRRPIDQRKGLLKVRTVYVSHNGILATMMEKEKRKIGP